MEHFENEFCEFLGIPSGSAIAVSSGTAALYLALIALDAQGENITSPVYSCTALRNAIGLAGGNLLLTDSHVLSPNMNIHAIDSEADMAIIPHMYGLPQDLSTLQGKLFIIEDCAQSLGASVNQIPVGLQGDIGIYSFYATKLITSGGQGGMIVSKNTDIIEKLKDYRRFDQRYDDKLRFNFQMTDLQAAIGRVQLRQLSNFLNRRSDIFNQYEQAGLLLLDTIGSVDPVRFRAILQTTKQRELIAALKEHNISATIPLQDIELLGAKENYPNAYSWTQNTISLPIYPSLKDKEVNKIIRIVKRVLEMD